MWMAEKMGLRKLRLANDLARLTGHFGFIETKWLFDELSTPPDKPPAENGTAVPAGPRNGGNDEKANGAFESGIYGNTLLTASVGGAA